MLKYLFLLPYNIVRWIILIALTLFLVMLFILERPQPILELLKQPLQKEGIYYGKVSGGLLSGFSIYDLNYQNQAKAKELSLKIDLDQLEERLLYIDKLNLTGVEIDEKFLKDLIGEKEQKPTKEEHNITLPFDRITLNNATIELKRIQYENYFIKMAKLEVKNLHTDMKKQYKGDLHLLLDSNITQLNLKGTVNNENVTIKSTIVPNRNFIQTFITKYNLDMPEDPRFRLKADGNLSRINYQLTTQRLSLKQTPYQVQTKVFTLKGYYLLHQEYLLAQLTSHLVGNMGELKLNTQTHLKIKDLNNTLKFKLQADLIPKAPFINQLLKDQNISFQSKPNIKLKSQGDLKKLTYQLKMSNLKLKHLKESIQNGALLLSGDYHSKSQDLRAKLQADIQSNLATLELQGDTQLNLKDLNNTLTFTTQGEISTHKSYFNQRLKEHNITITKDATIQFNSKGKLNAIRFDLSINGAKLQHKDLSITLLKLHTKGESNILSGTTKLDLVGALKSSAGDLDLTNQTQLNFKDLNRTLQQKSELNIQLNPNYLNQKIKDQNITLEGTPHFTLTAQGGLERMILQAKAGTKLYALREHARLKLKTTPIQLDLAHHTIQGALSFNSNARSMDIAIASQFDGDYTQPKKITTNSTITLNKFNAFGLNLSILTPLKLSLKSGKAGAYLDLDSERIQLHAKSLDYDHFTLNLKSRNLYLYKIIKLPPELDHKFIKLDLQGKATLSRNYFSLKGALYSNKRFKATINLQNRNNQLRASLHTKHLALSTHGDIKKRHLDLKLDINSLNKVEQEFNALYAFDTIDMEGELHARATMRGEAIQGVLYSKLIQFKDFNINDLEIKANYNHKLLTLEKFNFQTTGFKDKKLNNHFYLNQKGLIHLGERRDILIDIHPNIYIQAQGTQQHLQGSASIEKLPLGHPEYGSLILTTSIDFQKNGEKNSITGDILLKKMKLFYEAKFLDPANDPDVVIITKKDKTRKKLTENNFIKNTAIDLQIRAPQANYKTEDIDLTFDVKLYAQKAFEKDLALLGKIQEINGRVDQVPKRFKIVDSNIVFKGGKKINPLLDIKVEYELPQVLIYINIGGDANHPKLEFTSEPPMPKKDIMSYLLFGVSTASLAEGEGSLSREAELFILNQAARDLAYELGLDRIFIKDDGTGEGFAIEAGKKISPKNMVIIESSKEGNSFILEHDINKNIKLRVGQHQKEIPSQSIDIYFRKKFR